MMDIINPWGALRRVTKELATTIGEARDIYWEASALRSKLAEAERQRNDYEGWVRELQAQIAQGHFRNPKTGRIGRKGETFSG